MSMTGILLRGFILLGGSFCLCAETYHVSPDGDDANTGTDPTAPFQTIGRVNSLDLQPGDVVLFESGRTFGDTGLQILAEDAGSAGNPVIIGSYGAGRATIAPSSDIHGIKVYNTGGVIIRDLVIRATGAATSTASGVLIYCDLPGGVRLPGVEVHNVEVHGFQTGIELGAWHPEFSGFRDVLIAGCLVRDCRRDGIITYGYYPGSFSQQSHRDIIIRDCEVHGVPGDPTHTAGHSGSGIIMSGTIGGLIERCHAWNNGGSAGNTSLDGPVGIWTWAADSVTIRHCLVHDQKTQPGKLDGGGFDIDGGSTNAVIEYCYSYNNDGPGYLVAVFNNAPPLANAVIRHCVSWGDGRGDMASGFTFWKANGTASTLSNVDVYNNFVYADAPNAGQCVHWRAGEMSGIRLRNNILVTTGGKPFVQVGDNTARSYFTFQGNLYYSLDGNYTNTWRWGSSNHSSLDQWRASSGQPETVNGQPLGISADPRLGSVTGVNHPVNIAGLLAFQGLKPAADSPVIDAAIDTTLPQFGGIPMADFDFRGHAIPQGPARDIGPFESPFPVVAPALSLVTGASSPAVLEFSYVPERTDLVYKLQTSTDLLDWETTLLPAPERGDLFIPAGDQLPKPDVPAYFLRLKVGTD